MTTALVLAFPAFNLPFIVETDVLLLPLKFYHLTKMKMVSCISFTLQAIP